MRAIVTLHWFAGYDGERYRAELVPSNHCCGGGILFTE